jgi:hypothetical protein
VSSGTATRELAPQAHSRNFVFFIVTDLLIDTPAKSLGGWSGSCRSVYGGSSL